MKLWLDDVRPKPDDFEVRAFTSFQAITDLSNPRLSISEISFDHDLGEPESINGTGYDVAKWIEEKAAAGRLRRLKWTVHSANPVGRKNIQLAMRSAERFWDSWEKLRQGFDANLVADSDPTRLLGEKL